jgi:hypothetical protein
MPTPLKKRNLAPELSLVCMFTAAGCGAAVVGAGAAGAVAYSKGELQSSEPPTITVVQHATLDASDE